MAWTMGQIELSASCQVIQMLEEWVTQFKWQRDYASSSCILLRGT